ncbi:MAG: cyclic nucleotide-binding domain-containing protein [Kofleriaceae bacterium]
MKSLGELEKRLREEPDNLGLRVMVAGALHEAGRKDEAVELYRSVAAAYRDQGRTQQAIAVCRSILEIAPDDNRCHALLAALVSGPKGRAQQDSSQAFGARTVTIDPESPPPRRSSLDETPLPGPLPYHVADPTTKNVQKLSQRDLPVDPVVEGAKTRPGSEDGTKPDITGLASAARRISASLVRASDDEQGYESLDLSAELETRQRPRIESSELKRISLPPPTAPVGKVDFDDAPTPAPIDDAVPTISTEEELTVPRELPGFGDREPITNTSTTLLASVFFAPLPPPRRQVVLRRFHRRSVKSGDVVIRQGETEHPLVIVGRGRLEVYVERNGARVAITSVGAGDHIGEVALLARAAATAHVVAATDAELLVLLPREFYEIVGAFPALWSQLKNIAERRTRQQASILQASPAST